MSELATERAVTELSERLSELLEQRGWNAATAESLTGGQLAAALAAVPSAGEWFRGGIVAYQPEVKHGLLQAPPGPVVTAPTAEAMASGAVELLGADCAVAVTGVGGPEDKEGKPAGTVWIATCVRDAAVHSELHRFDGPPRDVMQQTIRAALKALIARAESPGER